jgi:prophage DNA circulation protein
VDEAILENCQEAFRDTALDFEAQVTAQLDTTVIDKVSLAVEGVHLKLSEHNSQFNNLSQSVAGLHSAHSKLEDQVKDLRNTADPDTTRRIKALERNLGITVRLIASRSTIALPH